MGTPEEHNEGITAAIQAMVNSLPDETEGQGVGILSDWLTISCFVDFLEDGTPVANYYLLFKGRTMLPHIAKGLLKQAWKELASTEGGDEG